MHIGPWSTRLEPRIGALGLGLLGLVAGSGSNWFEGWGCILVELAARSSGGDGRVEAVKRNFVCVCCEVQILPLQTKIDHLSFESRSLVI